MKNTNFVPIIDYCWIVHIEGIPSYLVKSAERPIFKDGIWSPLKITLYNTTCFMLTPDNFDVSANYEIEISYLDPIGNKAFKDTYSKQKVCLFQQSKLDYSSDEITLTNIHFKNS